MRGLEGRIHALEHASQTQSGLAVTDASGVLRVEAGLKLPARGISPAQAGLRVSAADGTPIFDTLGLTSVMASLGSQFVGTMNYTVDPTVIAQVSFTLARQATVLALAYGTGFTAGAGGTYSHMWLTPDAVAFVNNISTWDKINNAYTNGGGFQLSTLAAGSHTYYLKAGPSAGQTFTVLRANLQVFLLGG